jgi:starch phosphorylase
MKTKHRIHQSNDQRAVRDSILYRLKYSLGKDWEQASEHELFMAVAYAVRDRTIDRMIETDRRYVERNPKRLYYLSIEYLIGRLLGNNLYNLGLFDLFQRTLIDFGVVVDELRELEDDAALGNGGLGRLAACFLDSLATLGMPGFGYGINYEFGLFKQEIRNGYQVEKPDPWSPQASPWLIERPEEACVVPLYGRVESGRHDMDHPGPRWKDWKVLIGVPYDMPVVGYGGRTVNVLRLFSARSSDEFDMKIFNSGDYIRAVEQKVVSETISKVLYPSDSVQAGKELRLIQEYFLVACSIRDIVRKFRLRNPDIDLFPEKVAIQLNDTHPALAVAELMRILLDENALPWEKAWDITVRTFGYTNHTLLPEALEKWPIPLFETVLPRHLEIIYRINHRFLRGISAGGADPDGRIRKMSIIEENDPKEIRMANLAIIGSHSINGVSEMHTELLKRELVPEFHDLWPERFNNKTNGVTQRRWLLQANPGLANLLNRTIGEGWITDLTRIREVEAHLDDQEFVDEFIGVKRYNKERLARVIMDTTRIAVDPESMFDIQVKRIHEYKRQLLNVMRIIHEFFRLVEDGVEPPVPKTYVFAGKAAPGYWAAKQIIKLINAVGQVINGNRKVRDLIRVVFIPDYRVTLAERIFPAADLSEQISTAGTEASGTGNMKFAMNGALTIGTRDGANIEILEEVGEENIFTFGLTAGEIRAQRASGSYHPRDLYRRDPSLRRVMVAFQGDLFCPGEPELFRWIFDAIVENGDVYFHLADLPSYIEVHDEADRCYTDSAAWFRKVILNVARSGKFSSDRTVREYADEIWGIEPVL